MMQVWAITDIGLVRRQNQDAYGYEQMEDQGRTIAVVCDGMGGLKGGEVASKLAVDAFLNTVRGMLREDMSAEQIREVASYAISVANSAIREEAGRSEEFTGMGTTLVSAISYEGGVVLSNVGDSRAYHISGDGIHRLTRDHSLVETLVERGEITEDEARTHPKRNYITRALGTESTIMSDGYIVAVEKGDYVLLCTDGLVSTVSDREMLREITEMTSGEDCLAAMMNISKENGAADNVTAVLLQML